MKDGTFHHTRTPTVKSRASTIQLLCPTCHKLHGHEYKTITKSTILGTEKVTKIVRKRVRKHPSSPYWKEKPKKKTTKPKKRTTRKKKTSHKRTKSEITKTKRKKRIKTKRRKR